jgi:hypothetical protein
LGWLYLEVRKKEDWGITIRKKLRFLAQRDRGRSDPEEKEQEKE